MRKNITFLGIETSCDETAAAVIKENETLHLPPRNSQRNGK